MEIAGLASDSVIAMMVYFHAVLMIAAGALVVANVRIGSLLMALAMIVQIATKDNPWLSDSEFQWQNTFLNMLKDLALIAVCFLIFSRKARLVHRRDINSKKAHKD
jgi:hypothetical protein